SFRLDKPSPPLLNSFPLIFKLSTDPYPSLLPLPRTHALHCHFTMGGHFPSLSYEQTLELVPELDSVVRFEGESTLLELVDAVVSGKEWREIHGLAYRDDERGVVLAKPRALLEDLDQLPYPDRDY